MGEPALKLVETTDVETRSLSIVEKAQVVKVVDVESYTAAGLLWKQIGDMINEVNEAFDKNIKLWHEGHKAALADKARYWNPLDAAKKSVKKIMSDYDAEQEAIRLAEQRRLEEIARKEEEERRRVELERLEAERKAEEDRIWAASVAANEAGNAAEAETLLAAAIIITEDAKQEAAAIMAEPVTVAPIILQKATPKLSGGPVYTTRWSASVTDVKALCKAIGAGTASTEFVIGMDRDKATGIITSPSLNKQATSLMAKLAIPGVMAISKRV